MFTIIRELFRDFEARGVRFVHWKSNVDLHKALRGYDDLDILVAPSQLQLAMIALRDHGLIEGTNSRIRFPNIFHFYGNDPETGNLVHVHLYAEVITGSSWTKSYRFPWTDQILDTKVTHESGMPVTAPHIEYSLYVIRALAKSFSPVESLFTGSHSRIDPVELSYLADRMDRQALDEFVRDHFSCLSADQLCAAAECLLTGGRLKSLRAALSLSKACNRYRRHSRLVETASIVGQLFWRTFHRLAGRGKKTPLTRTRFIAITGLDASGKSTTTATIKQWLGSHFRTDLIHVGAPPSAWATLPINWAIRCLRPLASGDVANPGDTASDKPLSAVHAVRYLTLAYDRYKHTRKHFGRSLRDRFVLCDRYPARETGVMDSRRLPPDRGSWFVRKLAAWENALYERIPEPDLVVRLHVPEDVAVERNRARIKPGKESDDALRTRYARNAGLTYASRHYAEIDTSGQLDETLIEIKTVLWGHIAGEGDLHADETH